MKIDVANKSITIDVPHMNSHHMRQLSFWGFKKDSKSNQLQATPNNLSELLGKIIAFFNKEKLTFELSENAQLIRNSILDIEADFLQRKQSLTQFKEGKFDKEQYREFVDFVTTNLKRKLKDHQLKAAFHLYIAKHAANFSVPGSGKTSAVLAVYEKLKAEGVVDTLFVVGPPASFGPWKHEFEVTLGRVPEYKVLAGGDKNFRKLEYYPDSKNKSELYLTTFQTLLRDHKEVADLFRSMGVKVFLVVDEAHYIKQLEGNWANAVLNIAKFAVRRCILTGTPIPKSYTDIFNLFDFLWPEHHPIDNQTKNRIQYYEQQNLYEETKSILDSTIGPLFYRVRKTDLALTPQIFKDPVIIPMNRYERIVYDAIANKIKDNTANDDFMDIELVLRLRKGRLIRLRQATSYTKLLRTAIENYDEALYEESSDIARYIKKYDELERPAKLEYLIQMLTKFRSKKEKVVIWSNFVETLELLRDTLNSSGFYSKLIYGKTPIERTSVPEEEDREKIRNEFVDSRSGLDILIANPAACAESISLHTTCHNAVYYDLSYNCAQYLQSLDRIHRVGGSEKIFANYYFLQYEDTIDQDIKYSLETKAEKMYGLIDQDYSIYNLDMFDDEEGSAYERLFKQGR